MVLHLAHQQRPCSIIRGMRLDLKHSPYLPHPRQQHHKKSQRVAASVEPEVGLLGRCGEHPTMVLLNVHATQSTPGRFVETKPRNDISSRPISHSDTKLIVTRLLMARSSQEPPWHHSTQEESTRSPHRWTRLVHMDKVARVDRAYLVFDTLSRLRVNVSGS